LSEYVSYRGYAHDIIKSFIANFPNDVRYIIRRYLMERGRHWRLFEGWDVIFSKAEVGDRRRGFIDVLWVVTNVSRGGWREYFLVIFEVKTGKYSDEWLSKVNDYIRLARDWFVKNWDMNPVKHYRYVMICRSEYVDMVDERLKKIYGSSTAFPIEPIATHAFMRIKDEQFKSVVKELIGIEID